MTSLSSLLLRGTLLLLFLSIISSSVCGNWALLGSFDEGRGSDQQKMVAFGKWAKPAAIQLVFTTFDRDDSHWLFNELTNIWMTAHVPMVTWEPWFWNRRTPSDIEVRIHQGNYNGYLDMWIKKMKTWLSGPDNKFGTADDRRVFLRFAHEFNGNWYPWSAKKGESTPADFVKMWRYVWNRFRQAGIGSDHLVWVWTAICYDLGDFTLEQYWPGARYVDWVGVNGLNWGTSESWFKWWTPVQLLEDIIPRLRRVSGNSKPIGITEFGTVSTGKGVVGKGVWLRQLFELVEKEKLRMVNYFNMDKMEGPPNTNGKKDWAVFGGQRGDSQFHYLGRSYQAYSAFRRSCRRPYFIGADTSRLQYIDDVYFKGTGTCTVQRDCLRGYICRGGVCRLGTNPYPRLTGRSLVVFNDTTSRRYWDFGSGHSISWNQRHESASEGRKDIQFWSAGWGGYAIGWPTRNVRGFKALRFSVQSTGIIKIEMEDGVGKKGWFYIGKTRPGQWVSHTIALTSFRGRFNLSTIRKPFIATMIESGWFAVDDIQFVR